MFTSGSTGDPQGRADRARERGLAGRLAARCLALGEAPVFMNQPPFSFDLSMYEVFGTLAAGGTCVLNGARADRAAPQQWLGRLAGSGVTVWVSTPSFAHQQLVNRDFSPQQLRALRTFLFCGRAAARGAGAQAAPALPRGGDSQTRTVRPRPRWRPPRWSSTMRCWPNTTPLPVGYAKPASLLYVADDEICIVGDYVMRRLSQSPPTSTRPSCSCIMTDAAAFVRATWDGCARMGCCSCRGRDGRPDQAQRLSHRLAEIDAGPACPAGRGGGACAVLRRPTAPRCG
nr:AMP-binding protein [Bordetella pertussis]